MHEFGCIYMCYLKPAAGLQWKSLVHMRESLVYQGRPISLAYWRLELGHRETQLPVSKRNGSSLIDQWFPNMDGNAAHVQL